MIDLHTIILLGIGGSTGIFQTQHVRGTAVDRENIAAVVKNNLKRETFMKILINIYKTHVQLLA